MAIAHSSTRRLASRSRTRSRNKWLPLSPPEEQALSAAGTAPPLLQPWREHATLRSLRDQLQLCFDCWNLLDAPGRTSHRCVYLPPGAKEPDANDRNRVEVARPSGFFRDALRTYAGRLSFLEYLALPPLAAAALAAVAPPAHHAGVWYAADGAAFGDAARAAYTAPNLKKPSTRQGQPWRQPPGPGRTRARASKPSRAGSSGASSRARAARSIDAPGCPCSGSA